MRSCINVFLVEILDNRAGVSVGGTEYNFPIFASLAPSHITSVTTYSLVN